MVKDKITFNFDTLKFEGITIDQVKFWENAYPNCDIIDILTKKMPAWLDGNPHKAQKKQWKRFIVGWLSRQEDRYSQFNRR